ncbi:Calpain-6 [Phlyctochytrium planicorne]|nr:Calpain-6 [Phlyctochytrium planicorne]
MFADRNEFWVSLVEKAYAKLRGCYKALESVSPNGAYVDLSGNVPETINLRSEQEMEEFSENASSLFALMKRAMRVGALMSCTMQPDIQSTVGKIHDSGLIFGYSYSISTVVDVRVRMSNLRRRSVQLVQLRNPWHNSEEGHAAFTGAWSDWSEEWQLVTKKEMRRLKLAFEDDGAFFMSFEDFLKYFTTLTICRQFTADNRPFLPKWSWQYYSSWSISNKTAGGCINYPESFPDNPQFLLELSQPAIVMISLMQREPGSLQVIGEPPRNLSIGFAILRVEDNRKYRVHTSSYEVTAMVTYMNSREVFGRARLDVGRYVLVPTTFHPNQEGDFMIRLHCPSSSVSLFEPLIKDLPLGRGGKTLRKLGLNKTSTMARSYPIGVLRAEVVGCTNLARQKLLGAGADPYCILYLVDSNFIADHTPTTLPGSAMAAPPAPAGKPRRWKAQKTRVSRSTLNPTFRSSYMWTLKRPRESWVQVEVWNRYPIRAADRFMGMAIIRVEDYMSHERSGRTWEVDLQLRPRGDSPEMDVKGSIRMRVRYEDSLEHL